MAPGTHPAIIIIQLTEVEVSVQPETWRARSATRRFRVKPPGYHFPPLCPSCRLLRARTVWVENLEDPISIYFCLNTMRGSFKACIYSRSPASRNPGIFFGTHISRAPCQSPIGEWQLTKTDAQTDQPYWIFWHFQLIGRYQVVMIE